MSSAERSCGVNLVKMGSQLRRNPHDVITQRLEERTKGVGLSKRIRTSLADIRVCKFTFSIELSCVLTPFVWKDSFFSILGNFQV